MAKVLKRFTESTFFSRFIVAVILAAGVLVGLETSPTLSQKHHTLFLWLDRIILGIFIVEIILKMGAHGSKPWHYFKDGWNIFDFTIVAVCLMPFEGQFAAVLRLARILRVLRLVHNVPRLQLLVNTLLRSIPSMGYVGILLVLLFYIYGVMGTFLFAEKDPVHFGTLGDSMVSLFRTVTMEDWTDLMYTQIYDRYDATDPNASVHSSNAIVGVFFFVSFILIGTMIMLNLFIGVIMSSMQEIQLENEMANRAKHLNKLGHTTIEDDIHRLEHKLEDVQQSLNLILHRVKESGKDEEE